MVSGEKRKPGEGGSYCDVKACIENRGSIEKEEEGVVVAEVEGGWGCGSGKSHGPGGSSIPAQSRGVEKLWTLRTHYQIACESKSAFVHHQHTLICLSVASLESVVLSCLHKFDCCILAQIH